MNEITHNLLSIAGFLARWMPLIMKARNQYTTRLDEAMAAEFEECLEITGMESSNYLKEAIRAYSRYVRTNGEFRMPFRVEPDPKSDAAKPPAATGKIRTDRPSSSMPPSGLNEDAPTTKPVVNPRAPRTRAGIEKTVRESEPRS